MTRWFSLTLMLLLPLFAAADQLRTLEGKVITGKTTSVNETHVILKTDAGEVSTPMAQVLFLDLRPAKGVPIGSKYTDVRLLDDTILHCQDLAFLGKEVELTLLSGAKFKLPLSYVTWYLRNAQDAGLAAQWEKLLKEKVRTDRVVVVKDGDLTTLEGVLGAVDPAGKTIAFTQEGSKPILAKLEKLQGLIFFRPDGATKGPICRVIDSQGNVLSAAKLILDKNIFQVTTTFGATVDLAEEAVARIDFNMGKLAFLSDLEPSKVVEKNALGLAEPYRRDTNLDGVPIILDRGYPKGLSMHAYTELEYDLGRKFKEFKAVVGVDPRIGTASKAKVSIYLDGALKFSETASVKTRLILMDVTGVGSIKIVVSSPDFFGLGDHATLADPQLSK